MVLEGSFGTCYLGSEGAVVCGWLGYCDAGHHHRGPAPRRHDVGGVHLVVHPKDSDACDVRSTTATCACFGRDEGDRSYCHLPGATGSALRLGGEFENATKFSYGTTVTPQVFNYRH
jgi:hypothetical protein